MLYHLLYEFLYLRYSKTVPALKHHKEMADKLPK